MGADFLEQAGIVLNMGQRYWFFESSPMQLYGFAEASPLNLNLIETIKVFETYTKRTADEDAEKSLTNLKYSCPILSIMDPKCL